MSEKIIVSALPKTWILDLDGTIVKHNGYKLDGYDTLLPGAMEFLNGIHFEDLVVILTSRKEKYRQQTIDFLKEQNIRYDHIIFDVPYGERIVVNDKKPSGLRTAVTVCTKRDETLDFCFEVDISL